MDKYSINQVFKDTINFIISNKLAKNKADIVRNIGIKYGNFAEIMAGRQNVGPDILSSLCENYNISAEWLLLGRGEVMQNNLKIGDVSNSTVVGANVNGSGNKISNNDHTSFIELLKKKDEQIDRLLGIIEKSNTNT